MLLHLVVGEWNNCTFFGEFRLQTGALFFCIYAIRLIARGTHPSHEKLSTLFIIGAPMLLHLVVGE